MWCVLSFVIAVAIAASVTRFPSTARAATPAQQPPSPAVAKLQQEQVDALRQAAELAKQLFQRGLGEAADVVRLNRELTETRLRMATSPKERATVLSDALATAKAEDDYLAQAFQTGLISALAVQESKAYRLSIEEMICVEDGK